MNISTLTDRDRALVRVGLWPIDCDPARPLNEYELRDLVRGRFDVTVPDLALYEPMIERGYLCFRKRA